MTKRIIPVRYKNELVTINGKTLPQLDGMLLANADNGRVTLALPSKSTAYISDIISSFYMFAHKSVIIQHSNISDTTTADYPYKNLKNFRRKRDASYNYFYRTTLYYDVR